MIGGIAERLEGASSLERQGVDGFSWLDTGLGGRIQTAVEQVLHARAFGDSGRAAVAVVEAGRWIEDLDPGERLEVSLQVVARWRWLWSVDGEDSPEEELLLTTLATWACDDIAELLSLALDGLDSGALPQERLSMLLRAASSSLFDLSHVLPRWRVVSAAAATLDREAATTELLSALETLRAAESRPSSRARAVDSNQEVRLTEIIGRARSSLSAASAFF